MLRRPARRPHAGRRRTWRPRAPDDRLRPRDARRPTAPCRTNSLVSPIARLTEAMLAASVSFTCAAICAFSEISLVATLCCSTALAIAEVTSLMPRIELPISRTAATAPLVELWIAAICSAISLVALAVWPASDLTSCATTAKPRPASPARAASMVALSASRLVCSATAWISVMTWPMRSLAAASPSISATERPVLASASLTTLAAWVDLAAGLGQRRGELLGGAGDRRHVGGRLLRGAGRRIGLAGRIGGGAGDRLGDAAHGGGIVGERFQHLVDRAAERFDRRLDVPGARLALRRLVDDLAVELLVMPHRLLEHLDGAGERADLVAAAPRAGPQARSRRRRPVRWSR